MVNSSYAEPPGVAGCRIRGGLSNGWSGCFVGWDEDSEVLIRHVADSSREEAGFQSQPGAQQRRAIQAEPCGIPVGEV